jgi:predicted esterase
VLLHGRGGSADDILSLAGALRQADLAYVAPRAPGHTWYPHSFLAPLEQNEPFLSRSLATVAAIVNDLAGRGIASDRVVLIGFSQGGCLALEFAARNPKRYAGIAGLSAGLIGPPGLTRDYPGSLDGTPVFLGCSDIDAHIPLERVRISTEVLTAMNAAVTERIYPGMGHTINQDEITHVRSLLESVNRAHAA